MKPNTVSALAIVILAGFAVCPATASAAEDARGRPKACTSLVVSADDTDATASRSGKKFRASRILDLRVRAVIPVGVVFGTDDVVTFRFTTPQGNLYQTIEVPVASPLAPGEKDRRRPGYPFPLEVQQPKSVTVNGLGAQSVEARLPVGGTAIMDSGLYGEWKVEGLVGDARPCSAKFELQP